jgi:hypothetical protein
MPTWGLPEGGASLSVCGVQPTQAPLLRTTWPVFAADDRRPARSAAVHLLRARVRARAIRLYRESNPKPMIRRPCARITVRPSATDGDGVPAQLPPPDRRCTCARTPPDLVDVARQPAADHLPVARLRDLLDPAAVEGFFNVRYPEGGRDCGWHAANIDQPDPPGASVEPIGARVTSAP